MYKNKFDFYEVVIIQPSEGILDLSGLDAAIFDYQRLVGLQGVIMAMVQSDSGKWLYEVFLKQDGMTYTIEEKDLVATGEHMKRSEFYAGQTVRIAVNPNTGEGKIVDED